MRLIDEAQVVSAFLPVNTQSGNNVGDWISLKNYRNVAVIFHKAVGSANDDPLISFFQATDVAGGDEKVLTKCTGYHKKQGASLATIGAFTEVSQSVAATVQLDATAAESAGLYIFSFADSDLDVANGFDCFKVEVADTGAAGAQLASLLYVLTNPRHASETLVSAIID
jgi:hypothetical protein